MPEVTILIPGALRRYTREAAEITATGADVRSAIVDAERKHPGLLLSVCDETGAQRPHVNLFVNEENVKEMAGLGTRLSPHDVLHIVPSISGG